MTVTHQKRLMGKLLELVVVKFPLLLLFSFEDLIPLNCLSSLLSNLVGILYLNFHIFIYFLKKKKLFTIIMPFATIPDFQDSTMHIMFIQLLDLMQRQESYSSKNSPSKSISRKSFNWSDSATQLTVALLRGLENARQKRLGSPGSIIINICG